MFLFFPWHLCYNLSCSVSLVLKAKMRAQQKLISLSRYECKTHNAVCECILCKIYTLWCTVFIDYILYYANFPPHASFMANYVLRHLSISSVDYENLTTHLEIESVVVFRVKVLKYKFSKWIHSFRHRHWNLKFKTYYVKLYIIGI